MAVGTHESELLLVRRASGLEVDASALQGTWTEEQYLTLTDHTNHLIEFTDGTIEVLPMPTDNHQVVLLLIYERLRDVVHPTGGKVLLASLRVQIRTGLYREPDVLLLLDANDPRRQNRYWLGADLVVEVVSVDNPERDTVEKVRDYAEAGVPEYWIVNPLDETVTVLVLRGDAYATRRVYRRGERASSALLEGFGVAVDEVFDAR